MQPSDHDFDLLASRLAEDISSEELQLEELGASVFSTAKLIELRGRFQERLENFELWQSQLMRIAIWSPICLLLGSGLLWLRIPRMGWFFLVAFPVTLAVCLAGVFLLYRNFGSKGRIEHWATLIENELTTRKKNKGK